MRSIPKALKTKQIDQRDSRNMRSGQINSLVQFPRKSQVKNTLQEVDVSLSKSTIKRRLHESKYREGSSQGANKTRLDLAKKHLKKARPLLENFLWTAEINLYQNDRKKRYGEGLERLMIQSITYVTLSVKTQLKAFLCDFLFSTKYHPSYDKEHSVKV